MDDKATRVLGFIGVRPGGIDVVCDGDSCVVAGSERRFRKYLATTMPDEKSTPRITKARYGHVRQAMLLGAAYSFDEESYARFLALAKQDGLDLPPFTPDPRHAQGRRPSR